VNDDERALAIMQNVIQLPLSPDVLGTMRGIADAPRAPEARAGVKTLLDIALARMPRGAARGRALTHQLEAEVAFFTGDDEAGLASLRAADEAKLFDVLWLDRCHIFDSVRQHPEFAKVHANVALRAQAIVAAYERARVSSRVRA
jgi:serine/threonine-protein kinase